MWFPKKSCEGTLLRLFHFLCVLSLCPSFCVLWLCFLLSCFLCFCFHSVLLCLSVSVRLWLSLSVSACVSLSFDSVCLSFLFSFLCPWLSLMLSLAYSFFSFSPSYCDTSFPQHLLCITFFIAGLTDVFVVFPPHETCFLLTLSSRSFSSSWLWQHLALAFTEWLRLRPTTIPFGTWTKDPIKPTFLIRWTNIFQKTERESKFT
jgi:hypothetical protein